MSQKIKSELFFNIQNILTGMLLNNSLIDFPLIIEHNIVVIKRNMLKKLSHSQYSVLHIFIVLSASGTS